MKRKDDQPYDDGLHEARRELRRAEQRYAAHRHVAAACLERRRVLLVHEEEKNRVKSSELRAYIVRAKAWIAEKESEEDVFEGNRALSPM